MSNSHRDLTALVPALVTAVAIIGLVVVARFYEALPVKPPECGFRKILGIPCVACGGTRSFQALAYGEFMQAIKLNPLVMLGVVFVGGWFSRSLFRYYRPCGARTQRLPHQNWRRKPWLIIVAVIVLAAANWIYLFYNLPKG